MKSCNTCICALFLLAVPVCTPARGAEGEKADGKAGFRIAVRGDVLEVQLDGQNIASYVMRHDKIKRPFFAHVKTPSGIQVTRNFPPQRDDPADHADMHPGLWMAFGKISGVDFWRNQGRIVHEKFVGEPAGGETASFVTLNRFVAPDGKLICRQQTNVQFAQDPAGYLVRFDAQFSGGEEFYFGVQEEMGLGVRVATPLRVAGGNGTILNSHGERNEKGTWGKVAQWWDYFGTIDGRAVGVMIMSAPGNPDIWSHSRDYGYLAANPFAIDIPQNRSQRVTVKPGETFRLRFGVLVHERPEADAFDQRVAYLRFAAE